MLRGHEEQRGFPPSSSCSRCDRVRAFIGCGHNAGTGVSDAPRRNHRAVRRRRGHRPDRAADVRGLEPAARPVLRRGEPARRQHQYRHARGDPRQARRSHAADGEHRARRQSVALCEARLRPAARPRADRADRQRAYHPRRRQRGADRYAPALIGYVKARPGELNYASYGVGSGPHLAAELFQSATGTRIVHVPYGGGGPAALGVIGNTVQMLFRASFPCSAWCAAGT